MADALNRFGPRLCAHRFHPVVARGTVAAADADLDQFVGVEGDVELPQNGIGQTVLTEANDRMTVMRTRPQETDLSRVQHECPPSQSSDNGARTVAQERGPFDEVKVDLGAIIVVAVLGAPLVMWLTTGAIEWILLGGYGVGAGVWLYCRTRGVLAAADASRRERLGGP